MSAPKLRPSWSVPVTIADLPKDGGHFELAASEAVRDVLAREAGLVALPRLEASFDVRRQGADNVAVSGRLSASVVQTCVVTLDPVASELDEPIELIFAPPVEDLPDTAGEDIDGAQAADPPEPLTGDSIDLGAIAVEALLLGLDPYPRKPGAVFEGPVSDAKDDGPFAALAALRDKSKGKD